MRIIGKWPTRSRRDLFFKVLKHYQDYLSGKHEFTFIITADNDDTHPTLGMNHPSVIERLNATPNLRYRFGNSKSKIQAVNADFDLAPEWDLVINISDDQIPSIEGFDDVIAQDMQRYWPGLDGGLNYRDGNQTAWLWTLSILGKKCWENLGKVMQGVPGGKIYDERFESLWSDNHVQAILEKWGKLRNIDRIVITHAWQRVTGNDVLHQRNSPAHIYNQDHEVYKKLLADGLPDEPVQESA